MLVQRGAQDIFPWHVQQSQIRIPDVAYFLHVTAWEPTVGWAPSSP